MISGRYSARGYVVERDGREVYRAGNLDHDSKVWVEPGSPGSLGLAAMRRFCSSTVAEMADEANDERGRVARDDSLFAPAEGGEG